MDTQPAVLIDGVASRRVDIADRGLQYGDGLFETIACTQGRPRWLVRHLDRLRLGCARLGISFEDFALLRDEIVRLAASRPRCLVKAIVTRGVAAARGYRPRGDERPTRIVSRHDWVPGPVPGPGIGPGLGQPAVASAGSGGAAAGSLPPAAALRLGISTVRLGENPALAGLKHLNRLEQVLAQRELAAAGADAADEALMLAAGAEVISATAANVFLLDARGRLVTPALERCGVAGIVRGLLLEAGAAAVGLAVEVRPVPVAELERARAIFLTNVRLGVQAVGWFGGRELAPEPAVQRLKEWIDANTD